MPCVLVPLPRTSEYFPVAPSDHTPQTDIIAVQRKFYGQNWSFGYQWLLVMSTQLIGFSMGGVVKRFLVSPPSMSWCNTSFEPPSRANKTPHSLARKSGHLCPFQHSTFSGLPGLSRFWNESTAFLLPWLSWLLLLVYVPSHLFALSRY
jgi:OPT oligopeptide transporter protein